MGLLTVRMVLMRAGAARKINALNSQSVLRTVTAHLQGLYDLLFLF